MSERYPGGIISKTPPTITGPTGGEGGSASGMWNLADVLENEKAGTWPAKILSRSLFMVGVNSSATLGLNDRVNKSSPVQLGDTADAYNSVRVSSQNSFFVRKDGTLWFSGANSNGQGGVNDVVNRSSPTQIGSLTNWSKVGGGPNHCIAVKTDGTLWAWGLNNAGELGVNDRTIKRSSPIQVGSDTDWSEPGLFSQGTSSCLKTDGSVYMWGSNNSGVLGLNDGFAVPRSSPVQIPGKTFALNGKCSIGAELHNLGVDTDGKLWSWGKDNNGNLGLNDRNIARSSPTQVGALTNWNQVSCSANQNDSLVMATKTTGTAWYWGWDRYFSGTNGVDSAGLARSSPVQIGSDTDWEFIRCASYVAYWKKTNGVFYGTGGGNSFGGYGQLGLGDTVLRSSPVQLNWIGTRTNATIEDIGMAPNSVGFIKKE